MDTQQVKTAKQTALDLTEKLQVLMAHNVAYILDTYFNDITYVLLGMKADKTLLGEGFAELVFWFTEGHRHGAIPEVFFKHCMRYVRWGIALKL